jgi:hypothetical protein
MVDAELIQAFIQEAESYLPIIRGGILIGASTAAAGGELETSLRQIHTIKARGDGGRAERVVRRSGGIRKRDSDDYRKKSILTEQDSLPAARPPRASKRILLETHFQTSDFALDIDAFIDDRSTICN